MDDGNPRFRQALHCGIFAGLSLLAAGCATTNSLPQSVNQVAFGGTEGKVGWSRYQQVEVFRNQSVDVIYDAAKAGLGRSGFSLKKADKAQGFVMGEHGITLHDWNVMVGVYFRQKGSDVEVQFVTQGSKDTGFSGDVTGDGWNGKIIRGMYEYLRDIRPAPSGQ